MLLQLKREVKKNWEMMFVATKLFTLLLCDGDCCDKMWWEIMTMVIITQQGGNSMIMVFIKGGDGSKLVFCKASLLHLTMVKVL
jgi:hypothetical protein